MVNELLVNLVNSVLIPGKRTSRGNISYTCPFCNKTNKLEINFTVNDKGNNPWQCWSCTTRGKTIGSLFKSIKTTPDKFQELNKLVKSTFNGDLTISPQEQVSLPKEFKTFLDSTPQEYKPYLQYLKLRNIKHKDILKYNIGYCDKGEYAGRVILPSYDSAGKLNYFTARSIRENEFIKYLNPKVSRDVIAFELFINWNLPIILCEGPFDALAIKRNAIPLMGKQIQPSLMKKLVESKVQKIYIALDDDAIKKSIEFCEELLNIGKEVYLVKLDGKDPSSLGFIHFTKLIQTVTPLTNYKLLELKLHLI
jgi:hypothetical protein